MRIGFILAGLLFFVNPNIVVVDILPDFIGAILILYGLSHAGEIDERIALARRNLYILMFTGIGRFLCTFLIPIIDAKEYTWFLVFAFCFGIIEAYLFCRSMFLVDAGLTYLSLKNNENDIYLQTGGTCLGMTVIFTVVKSIFSILPTLTYLVTDYGTVTERQTNWTFVMGLLMAVNVLLVSVYGIMWYLKIRSFWKELKKRTFLSYVESRYESEYLANKPLVIYRDLKRVTLLLTVAAVFAIPVRLDGIDVLPDFAAGICLLYAVRFLRTMYPKSKESGGMGGLTRVLAFCYTGISLLEWCYMLWLRMTNYSQESLQGFSAVMGYKVFDEMPLFTAFVIYCLLAILKLALFAAVILSMRSVFARMINEHTGSITEVSSENQKTKQVRKTLHVTLLCMTVGVVAAVLLSAVTTLLFLWVPILQTWDMLVSVVFVILLKYFMEKLMTGMDDRYYHEV